MRIAAVFATGVTAGVAGAYFGTSSPAGRTLIDNLRTLSSSLTAMIAGGSPADGSVVPMARDPGSETGLDLRGGGENGRALLAPPATNGDASGGGDARPLGDAELALLLQRTERQLSERHLEQPAGDNALETYSRLAAAQPDALAVVAIGTRLSSAFYVLARNAMAEERWADALHALAVLDALPPVPVSAVLGGKEGAPGSPGGNGSKSDGPGSSGTAPAAPTAQLPGAGGSAAGPVAAKRAADGAPPASTHPAPAGSAPAPSPSLQSPAQGPQPAFDDARLRQAFEQFLTQRQQAPTGAPEKTFTETNSAANDPPKRPGAAGASPHAETWQAVETTNLREAPSANAAVIGEVEKGSMLRVTDRSADGRWLEVETENGSTGYYWSARARKLP